MDYLLTELLPLPVYPPGMGIGLISVCITEEKYPCITGGQSASFPLLRFKHPSLKTAGSKNVLKYQIIFEEYYLRTAQ